MSRLDAYETHAGGHDLFHVHEHLRPIEALLIDQGVQEGRAFAEPGVLRFLEEVLQFVALFHEPSHFLAYGRRARAQRFIGFVAKFKRTFILLFPWIPCPDFGVQFRCIIQPTSPSASRSAKGRASCGNRPSETAPCKSELTLQ